MNAVPRSRKPFSRICKSQSIPHETLRGEIVHKIACLYLGYVKGDLDKTELEADGLANSWGFNNEIKALRDHQDTNLIK